MKDLRISIVYICDEKYVMPTCVSIRSIYENKQDSTYDIYIIGVDLSQKSKETINKINLLGLNIHLLTYKNKYKNLNTNHIYVSKAALFKFDIPNILVDLDKVLYIDSDTIILDDLGELFNTDIDHYYAGVVSNSKPNYKGDCAELCLNDYFNSGVMLLNLKTLRENNIPDKLYQDKLSRATRFMDQDCFNKVFAGHIKFLDPKCNYLTVYSDAYPKNLRPYIVHFASEKPWKKFDVKYGRSWDKYYLKSKIIII